jgi:hypothetical protein
LIVSFKISKVSFFSLEHRGHRSENFHFRCKFHHTSSVPWTKCTLSYRAIKVFYFHGCKCLPTHLSHLPCVRHACSTKHVTRARWRLGRATTSTASHPLRSIQRRASTNTTSSLSTPPTWGVDPNRFSSSWYPLTMGVKHDHISSPPT